MCRAVENDNQEKDRAVQVLQYHRALVAAVAVISSIGHGGGVGSIRPGPELIALTGQAAVHLNSMAVTGRCTGADTPQAKDLIRGLLSYEQILIRLTGHDVHCLQVLSSTAPHGTAAMPGHCM